MYTPSPAFARSSEPPRGLELRRPFASFPPPLSLCTHISMSSPISTDPAPTKGPLGPKEPPLMTPEELQAFINRSPKHKKIVKLYVPILVMGGVSTLFTAVVIGTSCSWGVEVVRAHKWLIFHYTCIGALALSHAIFCWRFRVDIENLEDPSQFQIDIGRIIITATVQAALLIYVFIKLKTVADATTFELGW
ncbi:hypothetical protein BCR35DRAFT_23731 [Leucosporidium creatinivorum]|uniref:Uncharacterized protein n=1 Tax=Leucosporidium creatinivorum TaxID=106004 RepID=A0A1Y2FW95_9BASI|nr:hypothetical protein BCR35DRAFT_23731 [Leucosporidium creatinivorum]